MTAAMFKTAIDRGQSSGADTVYRVRIHSHWNCYVIQV